MVATMTARPISSSKKTKYGYRTPRSNSEEEGLEVNLIYKDKEYRVKIPEDADRATVCYEIKRQTGVKGAFYLLYGDKTYLHSSSLTLSNIASLSGGTLEIRGGDWINKGGDTVWYYYSQTPRPEVQQKLEDRQFVPFDKPP